MEAILQAITQVGFPIALSIGLCYEIHVQNVEWRKLMAVQTDTWRNMIADQSTKHTAEAAQYAEAIKSLTAELRVSNEQTRVMLVKTGILDE